MEERLNQILARRRRALELWYRKPSLLSAVGLHVLILVALFVGPIVFAERKKPIEYRKVVLVTAADLKPAPKPKPKPKPKPPEPEPKKEPEPEPPPPQEDRPKLPSEDAKEKKAEPGPVPEPAAPEPEPESAASSAGGPEFGNQQTGIQFDNPNFVYGYYVDRMLSRIRAHWTRPPVGADVELVVHYVILRDGTVEELEVVSPSGYETFDRAGFRAVRNASPLPPLPRSYDEPSLGVTLRFR